MFYRYVVQCIDPAYDFVRNVALGQDPKREVRARLKSGVAGMDVAADDISAGRDSNGSEMEGKDIYSDVDDLSLMVGRSSALINNGGK